MSENIEKKKILFVCSEYAAGMISFASTIINAVSTDPDYEVHAVVVSRGILSYQQSLNTKVKTNTTFIEYPTNKITRLLYKMYPFQLLNAINQTCQLHKISTVHCLTVEYCLANCFKKLKKKYTIYFTLHDLQPHESKKEGLKRWLFEYFLMKSTKKNLKILDHIVTCSRSQYQKLLLQFPDKHLYYHHFPLLITPLITTGNNVCPELTGKKNYILFFGRVELYKGIEYLYEAFISDEILRKNTLVFAGPGHYYFPIVDDANIIKINRFIHDLEVAELFKNAACVVYPYISATQSGVIMLAYYFSTPVVASDIDFFKECVENEKTGLLFMNKDSFDLSEKIKQILQDTDLKEVMKKEQKQFLANYTQDALAKELNQIYNFSI